MWGGCMLKRVGREMDSKGAEVAICDAKFPAPFVSGLEYATPARGTWNIVHTGMLIPEAHEIFVCAAGCLRGVVLTAAELHAEHRFSTVAVREHNLLDGDMKNWSSRALVILLRNCRNARRQCWSIPAAFITSQDVTWI